MAFKPKDKDKPKEKDDKPKSGLQTLRDAMTELNKKHGDGTVMKMTDNLRKKIEVISTGAPALDDALGVGGFPRGRIIEIYGPEAGGKTTIALHVAAECQKAGGTVVFVDAEHALSTDYAEKLGINVKELILNQPDSGEQGLEVVEKLVSTGEVDLIIVDSVAALVPMAEIAGDMGAQLPGLQARLMGQACRKLTAKIGKTKTIVIFINQLRHKIGVMYGCLHADTLVNFSDGRSLPIAEVVNGRIEGEVWTFDEQTQSLKTSPITAWHKNNKVKDPNDWINILTRGGSNGFLGFTVTPNHQVLTHNGWKESKDLSLRDRLISRIETKVNGTLKDFLYGTLIADCHISIRNKNTACLKFQDSDNLEYIKWKINMLSKAFKFTKLKNSSRFSTEYTAELAELKRKIGERSPIEFLKNYSDLGLAVLIMDDGHLDDKGGHLRYIISFKRLKQAKELLELQTEFDKIGLKSRVNPNDGSMGFTAESSKIIAERIHKYIPECMQYKLPELYRGKYIPFELQNEILIEKIEVPILKITRGSKRMFRNKNTYDISVAGTENYSVGGTTNGVIVHNSPETTTGGNALKFYASVRLDVRKIEGIKDGGVEIGNRIKVKVQKNKVAPPFKICELDLIFGVGIDQIGGLLDQAVDLNIIKKSGSHHSYDDIKLGNGRDSTKAFLKENPKIVEIIKTQVEILRLEKLAAMDDEDVSPDEPEPTDDELAAAEPDTDEE